MNRKSDVRRRVLRLAGFVLAASAAAMLAVGLGTFRAPAPKPTLRVAAARNEYTASRLSPYGPGYEADLVEAFCDLYGYTPSWTWVSTWEDGWDALAGGRVDVFVGAGLSLPERHADEPLASSPGYAAADPVVVYNAKYYEMYSLEQFCRRSVVLQNLQRTPEMFADIAADEGCSAEPYMATGLDLTWLLTSMDKEMFRFAVADERLFRAWQPFHSLLKPTRDLPGKLFRHWYWREDSSRAKDFAAFWEGEAKGVSADLNVLYFSFLPEEADYYELWHIRSTVRNKLPVYRDLILEAAEKNHLDPLFLAAVIYQESRFDRHARSRTGVRGLMQISSITAEHLGLSDRTDPRQSVMGGARYLRGLYDRLEPYGLDSWNRWFVALAAYNQGFGHARDALRLAREQGTNERHWRNVKKAYKLLTRPRHYARARYGYARGYEAAGYVQQIRLFYYILNGLAVVGGREAQELAPLAAARPAGWPGI